MSSRAAHATAAGRSWWQIAALAALGPILLAIAALWLGGEYRRSEQTRELVRQSYEQRSDLERLFVLVQQAEAGQRGYLLSGDRSFLEPYAEAKALIGANLHRVAEADKGGKNARRFANLQALIEAKFAEMQALVDIRDRQGPAAASDALREGRGQRMMNDIRQLVMQLEDERNAALTAGQNASRARTENNKRLLWSTVGIVALSACIFGYLIGHGIRLRGQLSRESEEAALRQRAIFDSTSDAIILINPSGSIETINPAAERMFGYRAADVLRRDISTLIDIAPGDGSFLDRIGCADGRIARKELIDLGGRNSDGEPVLVDAMLGVMPLPDGTHIIAALRDAAGRREIERLKDDFISTVSHELRTPLTSVVGSLGLLRSGAAGELPAAAQRLAEIADNNSHRLIRLINDILDVDQIRKGRLAFDYAVIDLRDVVARTVHAMQGLADRKGITINTSIPEEPATTFADAERLIQVASNLTSNAIKFSPDGSTVLIELIEGSDTHIIQVTDKGPGIDPEFSKKLFNRFSQGSQPGAQLIAGTGLGLAISREIVHHHGGEISFENRSEGGARFAFTVPREDLRTGQSSVTTARLLICEDDPDVGSTIRSIVDAHGYASDLVTSVREGINHARSRHYDAVLLDLTLTDADGTEVIRALRANGDTRYLPVIIISGTTPQPLADDIGDATYADWVQKPFDAPRLVNAVQRTLRRFDHHRPVILHVDDDEDTRKLFAEALSGRGQILAANSLASARTVIADHRPDIAILDLGLPDGNGAALIPELRDVDGNGLSIVIYSAQDLDHATRQKVDAVLVKSRQSLPKLVATVMRIVDRKSGSNNG